MSVRESVQTVTYIQCLLLRTEPAQLASDLGSHSQAHIQFVPAAMSLSVIFDSACESPANQLDLSFAKNEEEEGCDSALQVFYELFNILGLPLQSVTNKMLLTNSSAEKCVVKSIMYCLSGWGKYLCSEEGETFSSYRGFNPS